MSETRATELTEPVDERDHTQGPADAPITLLEYGDYACPDCLQAHPIMIDIQEHFGDRLQYVFRHFPIDRDHPNARRAAESAEAAGAQGAYWPMHNRLYENQSALTPAHLTEYARAIGLDVARFEDELAERTHHDRVERDLQSGAASGVTGTPTFFINGIRHHEPWDLTTLIDALERTGKQ